MVRPGRGARSISRSGGGNVNSTRSPKSTLSPSSSLIARRMVAAWVIRIRWQISAQAAASYGVENSTGRNPGKRSCTCLITGSLSPIAAKPVPSASSDRIRSTWAWTAFAGTRDGFDTMSAVRSANTRTPPGANESSATNARSSRALSSPPSKAGNVSWNRAAAAKENGPRVVIWKLTGTSNHPGTTT